MRDPSLLISIEMSIACSLDSILLAAKMSSALTTFPFTATILSPLRIPALLV